MNNVARFVLGLLLALVLCAAAASALVMTTVTINDAVASEGSLESFEARLHHYSDRLEVRGNELRVIRTAHPFVLHFGTLALCWLVTFGTATALTRLHPPTRR